MLVASRGSRIWLLITAVNQLKRAEVTASHSPDLYCKCTLFSPAIITSGPEKGGMADGGCWAFLCLSESSATGLTCLFLKPDLLTSTIKGMLITPSRRRKVLNGCPLLCAPELGSQLPDRPKLGLHLSKPAPESL